MQLQKKKKYCSSKDFNLIIILSSAACALDHANSIMKRLC